jgi:hypothetical protein
LAEVGIERAISCNMHKCIRSTTYDSRLAQARDSTLSLTIFMISKSPHTSPQVHPSMMNLAYFSLSHFPYPEQHSTVPCRGRQAISPKGLVMACFKLTDHHPRRRRNLNTRLISYVTEIAVISIYKGLGSVVVRGIKMTRLSIYLGR